MMFKEKKNLVVALGLIIAVALISGVVFLKPKAPKTTAPGETESLAGKPGAVTGRLCYPSQVLPKGQIIAKNIKTGETIVQNYPGSGATTNWNYSFELKPGEYRLRYDVTGPEGNLISHFYTNYSDCALKDNCGERKSPPELLVVRVEPGKTVENIHLCDSFYSPSQIDF